MASLKSYEWKLATMLGVSPASLYERQRFLTRDGFLVSEPGRGPGSGVRADPQSLSTLMISILASDSNVDTKLTSIVGELANSAGQCPLTGRFTFAKAMEHLLRNENLAAEVHSISLHRPFHRATIEIKPSRHRGNLTSVFDVRRVSSAQSAHIWLYAEKFGVLSDDFSVSAAVSGNLIRIITQDLNAFAEEK